MTPHSNSVFTIGHSTHTVEHFLELLRAHDVAAVADVRSTPGSRFNPQFNRRSLEASLRICGIKYVYLGDELGARSKDPTCYVNGLVQYSRLAATDLFRNGIDRLIRGAGDYRIAVMCAEKEPLECHRTLLVGRVLAERGVSVAHIHGDGRVEPHELAMVRLLDILGLPRHDLFRTTKDLMEEALSRQEARIAYLNEKLTGNERAGSR